VADERDEKPETTDEGAGRETQVGHPIVETDAAPSDTTEVFFSRDEPESPAAPTPPAAAPQPAAAPSTGPSGTSPAAADRQAAQAHDAFTDKPELFVAGAFVGAFVLAKLLKKLTGSDD
jgi:hypothetical protein